MNRGVAKGGAKGTMPPPLSGKINQNFIVKKKENKKSIGPDPKNSGPNPRRIRFLVGGTLGPRQVCPLLDKILATCLALNGPTQLLEA